MAVMAHRVVDDAVVDDLQPRVEHQAAVGVGVEVAPVHRRAEPALGVVVAGVVARPEAQQREPSGLQDAVATSAKTAACSVRGTWMMA